MPKIVPLRELKNASKISELANKTNSPIFVTKNGESDLVILTSKAYDKLLNNKDANKNIVSDNNALFDYITSRDNKPLYSISELKQALYPILKKHKVKKAILFGSYVKGTADTRSDIDLMVDTNLKGLEFYGLLGEIADTLRFPVDLIDKREIEKGSDFENEIKKTGVTIYE